MCLEAGGDEQTRVFSKLSMLLKRYMFSPDPSGRLAAVSILGKHYIRYNISAAMAAVDMHLV